MQFLIWLLMVSSLVALEVRSTPQNLKTSVIIPCHIKHLELVSTLLERLEHQTVLPDEVVIAFTEHQCTRHRKAVFEALERQSKAFPVHVVFAQGGYPC